MVEIQRQLLVLVKELDAACKKADIPYILYGSTAAWAARRKAFIANQGQFEVLVPAGYLPKLKKELLSSCANGRAVEDFSTNPKMAYNVMRFVNTDTTFFDRADHVRYDHLGLAVVIHPAYSSELKGLARAIETTLPYLHGGEAFNKCRMTETRAKAYSSLEKAERVFGAAAVAKRCYGHLKKDKPSSNGKLCYVVNPQIVASIDARQVFEAKQIEFEGMMLPVANDMKAYLKSHYGRVWKAKGAERPATYTRPAVIHYEDLPYMEALELMKTGGVDLRSFQERDYQAFMETCTVIRPLYSAAMDSYQIADMSRARIDLFVEYEPLREELRRAAETKDVDTLKSMLSEYLAESERFWDEEHQGLYIDDELLGFARIVWEARGKTGYAEEIYAAAPQAFKDRSLREHLKDFL